MKTKHMSALLRDDITTVAVNFMSDIAKREMAEGIASYTFKVLRSDAAAMKDAVVVVETQNGMRLAQVSEVHDEPQIDPDFDGDYRWVVQVVDMGRYRKIIEHEREMDKVMLSTEREVKKRSVVQMYKETLGKSTLGTQFAHLLEGPVLEGTPAVKRARKK